YIWFAEPVESRPQLLVVDRHLTVEHQGPRRQLGDRRRDAGEAPRVIAAVAAYEAHARAVFVREHPPPVDLLLVDPAIAVEGLADERRGHRSVIGQRDGYSIGSGAVVVSGLRAVDSGVR